MDTILEKQLKAAILKSGLTRYRIAKDTKVQVRSLDRFMSGERTLRLDIAGRIAQHLGLQLVAKGNDHGITV